MFPTDPIIPKQIVEFTGDLVIEANINSLKVVLPETIGGMLALNHMISAKDLVMPKIVKGDVHFGDLTTAKGLKLPMEIHGDVSFEALESIEDLELTNIDGRVLLSEISDTERKVLRAKYPHLRIV